MAYLSNHWKGKKDKAVSAQDLIPTARKQRPKLELSPLMTPKEFSAAVRERARQVQNEWIEDRLAEEH